MWDGTEGGMAVEFGKQMGSQHIVSQLHAPPGM
jgi:hypothetical protein